MKIKRKTLDALIWWGVRALVFSFVVGCIFIYTRTPFFVITSYDITGVTEADRSLLVDDLHKNGEKVFYHIFENNKILTYRSKTVKDTIIARIPDVSSISVRSSGIHALHIEVKRHTALFQTDDGKGISSQGVVFVTNEDIHALPVITVASSTTETDTIYGISRTRMFVHGDVVSEEGFLQIADFASKVSSVVFPVYHISLHDDGDIVFEDVRRFSSVMIRSVNDYKKSWSTLVSAIDTSPLRERLHNEKDSLAYLDVRFGNKVFYKFGSPLFQNASSTGILLDHDTSTTTIISQ